MELRDTLLAPAAIGMGFAAAAAQASAAVRHARDLQHAQAWIDHLAASAAAADQDFRAVVAQLSQARAEAAGLRAALEESDQENLTLTMQVRTLKGRPH